MAAAAAAEEKYHEIQPSFSTLKFQLLLPPPTAAISSPEHPSGTATPPLQTLASIPFKWEEQPGKPRPCTDIIALPKPAKCLDLPPCRMLLLEPANKSPTTILDGPYNLSRPKFSSFRLFRESRGSFDDSCSSGSPHSSVDVLLGKKSGGRKTRRFFGSLRFKSGKEEDGGSLGVSPSAINGEKCTRVKLRRNGSFSGLSRAPSTHHLWGSIYESLKQAVWWKSSRKSKKEELCLKEYHV